MPIKEVPQEAIQYKKDHKILSTLQDFLGRRTDKYEQALGIHENTLENYKIRNPLWHALQEKTGIKTDKYKNTQDSGTRTSFWDSIRNFFSSATNKEKAPASSGSINGGGGPIVMETGVSNKPDYDHIETPEERTSRHQAIGTQLNQLEHNKADVLAPLFLAQSTAELQKAANEAQGAHPDSLSDINEAYRTKIGILTVSEEHIAEELKTAIQNITNGYTERKESKRRKSKS